MDMQLWVRLAAQVGLLLICLIGLCPILGAWIARVYAGDPGRIFRDLLPVERLLYRIAGVRPEHAQSAREYATSVLIFSLLGILLLVAIQRAQGYLPLNPEGFGAVPWDLAFNAAVSFVTNTNWQSYGGETTLSHGTQMLGMTVQNFVSAGAGMAVMAALARGLRGGPLGNFWVDLCRGCLYVLLPMSLTLALFLASQGVVQTMDGSAEIDTLDQETPQRVALGPVASQVAIKQLGTNGGGYYNSNSAHPLENPTPASNFAQCLAILLIPGALCFTFGAMIQDPSRRQNRHGWTFFAAMAVVWLVATLLTAAAEQECPPALVQAGSDTSFGNLEGKEQRFGASLSAIWATSTTAASNGSVNAMHGSFTPLGSLAPLLLILIGEVIFGGVGSGIYGMAIFAITAVFLSGLMVGRTPEYLGKKIGAFEIKMTAVAALLPGLVVLLGTAVACVAEAGLVSRGNAGPRGFSEILYAFASAANNNGSAMAGLNANTPFYNLSLGLSMLLGRFGVILPVLALAGSMSAKKASPPGPGSLPTDTPLFAGILIATIILVAALSFFPALALGPVIEHLVWGG